MTIPGKDGSVNIFDLAEEVCARLGIEYPKNLNTDDRIYRTSTTDGRGRNKNGAIKLFSDGRGGIAWNWKTGEDETFFIGGKGKQLTEAERQEIAKRRKGAAEALQRQYDVAAARARRIWKSASLAIPDHSYLARKGIEPYGVRERWGKLIIPVYGVDKKIISVQMIAQDGEKRFLKGACNGGIFVLNAERRSGPILIAEGFATAASLAEAMHYTVICAFNASAMGKAAKRAKASAPDRPILICGDNDHLADKSEAQAEEIGCGFVIPDFEGFERGEKGTDFNDLAQLGGLSEVGRQIRYAIKNGVRNGGQAEPRRRVTPQEGQSHNSAESGGGARQYVNGSSGPTYVPTLPIWRSPDLIPNRPFIFGRHYIRKYVGITIAPGGIGKSALLTVEALSMATAKNLIGTGCRNPRRVWYIGEDDRIELERRFGAAIKRHGLSFDEIGDRLFFDSFRNMPLLIFDGDLTGQSPVHANVQALIDACKKHRIDVLMIDPFVKTHSIQENDNQLMDAALTTWARIAEYANIAVELVVHSRKQVQGADRTIEDARGASAQLGAARDARLIVRMTPKEAAEMGIEEKEHRRYIRVGDAKANMSINLDETWYRLDSVILSNAPSDENADNQESDNVQVVSKYRSDGFWLGISKSEIDKVMREFQTEKYRFSHQSEDWAGIMVGEILDVQKPEWIRSALKKWESSGAIKKFSKKDRDGDLRPFYKLGNWEFSTPVEKIAEEITDAEF